MNFGAPDVSFVPLFSSIPEAKLLNAYVLSVFSFSFKTLVKESDCVLHCIHLKFCFKEATDLKRHIYTELLIV